MYIRGAPRVDVIAGAQNIDRAFPEGDTSPVEYRRDSHHGLLLFTCALVASQIGIPANAGAWPQRHKWHRGMNRSGPSQRQVHSTLIVRRRAGVVAATEVGDLAEGPSLRGWLLKQTSGHDAGLSTVDRVSEDEGGTVRIRCPLCSWQPTRSSRWSCSVQNTPEPPFESCGTVWNTFDTRGRCPGCLHQWIWTTCIRCGTASLHEDWYEQEKRHPV